MKALLFGIAAGTAVQAWRNFPPDGPQTTAAVQLLAACACVASFLIGRGWRSPRQGPAAVAHAEATAVASNMVNVAVVVPGQGAGSGVQGVRTPVADCTPWLDGPRQQVEASSVVDGIDPEELAELVGEHTL